MSQNRKNTAELAIYGGEATQKKQWPKWPQANRKQLNNLKKVLKSNQWAITSFNYQQKSQEDLFTKEFALFNNSKYCVAVDHGTNALVLAMIACGVNPGDEVIVPGLTWYACITSIISIGAIPVIVDVDKSNMSISVDEIKKRITKKTKLIMVVHLYCNIADLKRIQEISLNCNIPFIEDCSQSHGAIYNGKKVGTFGKVGVFSMQAGKPLTCGEGGACITDDEKVAEIMYRYKTDGRIRLDYHQNNQTLVENLNFSFGRNFCQSEIHLAILRAQLQNLEQENRRRFYNFKYLQNLLLDCEDISFMNYYPSIDSRPTIYHVVIIFKKYLLKKVDLDLIGNALSKELNTWVHRIYKPADQIKYYSHWNSNQSYLSYSKMIFHELNKANSLYNTSLVFHHSLLLSNKKEIRKIAYALKKVIYYYKYNK
jgi:dTDP-4-amino-4,6-dideoxygalactose transaminase